MNKSKILKTELLNMLMQMLTSENSEIYGKYKILKLAKK